MTAMEASAAPHQAGGADQSDHDAEAVLAHGMETAWVSPKVVADWLCLSERWVIELANRGAFPRSQGRYDLAGCIRARCRMLEAEADQAKPDDLAEAKATAQLGALQAAVDKRKADIDRVAMDNQEHAAGLVERSEFLEVVQHLGGIFDKGAADLPGRFSGYPAQVCEAIDRQASVIRASLRACIGQSMAEPSEQAAQAGDDHSTRGRGRPPKDRTDLFTPQLI